MYFSMKFKVEGLVDYKELELLEKSLMSVDGVKEVQISGPSNVNITYNPIRVIPSRLMAILASAGSRG